MSIALSAVLGMSNNQATMLIPSGPSGSLHAACILKVNDFNGVPVDLTAGTIAISETQYTLNKDQTDKPVHTAISPSPSITFDASVVGQLTVKFPGSGTAVPQNGWKMSITALDSAGGFTQQLGVINMQPVDGAN